MRLIDADALTFTHDYVTADGEPCITKAVIDNAPTIDAVPVVRCKDCLSFRYGDGVTYCAPMGVEMQPTDFCSYGERKDDESVDS